MPRIVPSQIVELIDQIFPEAKKSSEGFTITNSHTNECAVIIALTDQIPNELLVLSGQKLTDYTAAIAAIKNAIETWKVRRYGLDFIAGYRKENPISLLRQALAECPDEFPSPLTAQLSFITDPDLKKNLELDISSTNNALSNGEWKAATVLAGSVLEALLFWAISNSESKARKAAVDDLVATNILRKQPEASPEKWNLHIFIEVAAKLNIIKTESSQQARLAKEFRNLIHPGREMRLGQKCNRGTALSAVAAMEHVIQDLS